MDYYLPSTPDTRRATYTCPVCKEQYAGGYFIRKSEPHPDIVAKHGYDPKKYRRKKYIDLRACRFCHMREYHRAYTQRLKDKALADTRAMFGEAILNGREITDPRLLPPEAQVKRVLVHMRHGNYDPVLLYCKAVLKDSKRKRAEVLRKAEVLLERKGGAASGECDSGHIPAPSAALAFLKYQWKLYTARIDTALSIRERRRVDLQNPVTASDPVRLDWSAYVTPEEKARVVRAARRANQHRVAIVLDPDKPVTARVGARPFTWMPNLSFRMDNDDDARRKLVRQAWSDHIARAKNSEAKASKFIRHTMYRDPEQTRARRFTPTTGPLFTMEQFYRVLAEAAHVALDKIEHAIAMEMGPTNYTESLDNDERMVVTRWEQLVPAHYAQIRRMRTGLDGMTNNKMDPFSRLFVPRVLNSLHPKDKSTKDEERKRRRNRFQIANGLDHNNMALPTPAPAMQH